MAAEKTGIALPPDKALLAELCAYKWQLVGNGIKVDSRDKQLEILGHSPDLASAYFLALNDTPKQHIANAILRGKMDPTGGGLRPELGGYFD